MIRLEHFSEPKLQFAQYFEHEDAKTGLAEYGPFGVNVPGLHPSEIKLGFIGTRETIEGAKEWISQCASTIESENVKRIGAKKPDENTPAQLWSAATPADSADEGFLRVYKILNRDFIGFSSESNFRCQFQLNDRWDRIVRPIDIKRLLDDSDEKKAKIEALVELFSEHIRSLATTAPVPHVIVVALTSEIEEYAESVQISGNYYFNFRRALKAKAMKWGVPIQLLRRRTILASGKELQEKATRAWNFCTAMYFKADGVPWRPVDLPADTCFIGIDFYVAQDLNARLTVRASVAQAFDHLGQGVVLRGDPFDWNEDTQGRSPHMTKIVASKLISKVLKEYLSVRGHPPKRVVIHKSSRYWGAEHGEYDELAGLQEGIEDVFKGCDTDFVTVAQSGFRFFREGMYPPLRGTYVVLGGERHFLYTMGYIPFLQTYPGSYVPEPWELIEHHGGSSPKDLLKELLILTKMNVNNCSFADGVPITLAFSHKVGEVMKHLPMTESPGTGYKLYM